MLLTRAPLYIIRLTMPYQETLYEVAKRVATITLNRPDKLNAWTAVMEQEVRAAMAEAERDENVRVIVLTGAGRGFCSAEYSRDEGVGCGAAGAGGASRHGFRARLCFRFGLGRRQRASGFSEEIFVLPGDEQAGDWGDQRSGGGAGTGDCAVLRFAFCFGCGAIQHGVCATRIDCGVRDGVDAAAAGGTCERAGFAFFRATD